MDVVIDVRRLRFPEPYNAAECFIDRHSPGGRRHKIAVRTLERDVTYAQLFDSVNGLAIPRWPIWRR
jgi:hypothetical protein